MCVFGCVGVHLLTHRRTRGSTAAQVLHPSSVAARFQYTSAEMHRTHHYVYAGSERILVLGIDRHWPWVDCQPKRQLEWETQIHMTGLDNSNERHDILPCSPVA